MTEVYIQAITEMGCCVYTTITVPEYYTMNQMVQAVKRRGFTAFRITNTMRTFVNV